MFMAIMITTTHKSQLCTSEHINDASFRLDTLLRVIRTDLRLHHCPACETVTVDYENKTLTAVLNNH